MQRTNYLYCEEEIVVIGERFELTVIKAQYRPYSFRERIWSLFLRKG